MVRSASSVHASALPVAEGPRRPAPRAHRAEHELLGARVLPMPMGLPADGAAGARVRQRRPLDWRSAALPARALSAAAGAAQRPRPRGRRPRALGRPLRSRQRRPVRLHRVALTDRRTHHCVHRDWLLVASGSIL